MENYEVPYNGFEIIANRLIVPKKEFKQFRFPKSKKFRIRKKWAKRLCNYRIMKTEVAIKHGNKVYVSPETYERIKKLDYDWLPF